MNKQVLVCAMAMSILLHAVAANGEGATDNDIPVSAPQRTVSITYGEGGFMVGEVPLFIDNYTRSGSRGGGMSGNLRDAVLDLSSLDKGQWIPLGVQDRGAHLAIVCAEQPKLVVTADGLVYPLGTKKMAATGPYIRLKLLNKDRDKVDPTSLTVKATSGARLLNHAISDNLVVVSEIGMEPISLTFSVGTQEQNFVLFPYVRGASPELVAYNVYNVTIGEVLEAK